MNRSLPEVPTHLDLTTRNFLTQMRNAVIKMQQGAVPPEQVTNFKVTPIAGGCVIQFTRPLNADRFTLFAGNTASMEQATPIDLASAATYKDDQGKGAVARFYWVKAWRGSMDGPLAGPLKGVTLALGVAATVPAAPIPSDSLATDTDGNVIGIKIGGGSGQPL